MAEAKTKATAESVSAFIDAVADDGRRRDCKALVKLMSGATGEKPKMWGSSIVGFGKYVYRYDSGRQGEWPIVGFSPRKGDLTLYLMDGYESRGELLKRLGKHKTGKSCLYLKSLADVDAGALKELVDASVAEMRRRHPD